MSCEKDTRIVERLRKLQFDDTLIEAVEKYFESASELSRYEYLVKVIDFIDDVLEENAEKRTTDQ